MTCLTLTTLMTTKALTEKTGIEQRAVEKQIEKHKREGRLQRMDLGKGGLWKVKKVDK